MIVRFFLILIVAFMVIIFFNPFVGIIIKYNEIKVAAARENLPAAHVKWDEQNIGHYSFEIWATNHVCFAKARVEVRDEKVIQVDVNGDMFSDAPTMRLSPTMWINKNFPIDVFPCHYTHFTMAYLFDKAEQYLNVSDSRCLLKISFDRAYGFVSKAIFEYPPYGRLAGPRMDGCNVGFRIENFQVLGE